MNEGGHRRSSKDRANRLHIAANVGSKTLVPREMELSQGVVDWDTWRTRRGVKSKLRSVNPAAAARDSAGADNGALARTEERVGLK